MEPAPSQIPSCLGQRHFATIAADAQRDIARLPMHFTRLSDEQEISIGRQLAANYSGQAMKLTPEDEALKKYVRRVGRHRFCARPPAS